jgi:hypothetical protein
VGTEKRNEEGIGMNHPSGLRWAARLSGALLSGLLLAPPAAPAAGSWGTFERPFAADSPWNSRPIAPVLDDYVIPKSSYYPLVGEGKYSLSVFLARPSDPPLTVYGPRGRNGIWDPDAESHRESVTVPRWPGEAVPAQGSDGHADIVDPEAGIIHSFFQLRREQDRWVATQYAWSRIDGRGWGDPAHYFQGARAAAVPSMAGLVRKHEVNDGDAIYRHALAVSLTFNGMAANPSFVFPATSADHTAAKNTGRIPEGALLMLPESFDTSRIADPQLRKVADTLKVYGAYVVDRNVGTPFYIYVENGSGFNLGRNGWNSSTAAQLERIRQSLRQVVSTSGWIDGDGRKSLPDRKLNLLSMRGPWRLFSGDTPGSYETWEQAVVFPQAASKTVQINASSRVLNPVYWARPAEGAPMRLTVRAQGGAKLRLHIYQRADKATVFDSGELGDGQSVDLKWPGQGMAASIHAISGTGRESRVGGELVEMEN